MTSTFTPNINLEEPARGDDVGTWDTPVNANMTLIDLVAGGVTTITLNNSPVVLSAAQYKSAVIVFNSTQTGDCAITFPTSFIKPYTIRNACTGSSAFVITMLTTASATQTITAPPGESIQVYNDGTSLNYLSLDRVGTYWDYAGSSVPRWVSQCTVPPYLNCDGTAISSAYTLLQIILGSSLLPDSKGRARFALDQSAGRISSAATGFSGSSVGASGGAQATTLVTANLPPYTPAGSVSVSPASGGDFNTTTGSAGNVGGGTGTVQHTATGSLSGTPQGGTSTPFTNLPPAYIGGITMIRAG